MNDPTQPPDTRWVHPFLRQPDPGPEVRPPAREPVDSPRRPAPSPAPGRPAVVSPRQQRSTVAPAGRRRRAASEPPPSRRLAWVSLAVGLALMTGVQLAEARTTTGSGDFAVAATPAAPAPSAPASSGSSAPSTSAAPGPTTAAPVAGPTDPSSPAAPSTSPSSSLSSSASDSGATEPSADSAAPTATPEPPAPVAAGIPLGFELPRLGVQAPIDPVGMADGELEVPEDITRLGWWTGSTAAGGPSGTTVIDGHIDSPQGRGVFYHLQEVQPDDQVVLTVAGGATVTYRVTERRSYHKADGLPPEVFATTDQSRLVLITCGGRYDFAKASYDDNIVVIAVPA